MEVFQFKTNLKNLFATAFLTLLLFGCSSSDNNNSEESCDTFLECYGGSKWIANDGDNSIYLLRFNNNTNFPFEDWVYDETAGDCYWYLDFAESTFTIVENTNETLVLSMNDLSPNESETLTFTFVNGELKMVNQYITPTESGQYINYLQETTNSFDSLVICDKD